MAIHLDLDVLDPLYFRSLYFAELGVTDFPSSAEKMTSQQLSQLMQGLQAYDIVGLTIAEYLPWEVQYLQQRFAPWQFFSINSHIIKQRKAMRGLGDILSFIFPLLKGGC